MTLGRVARSLVALAAAVGGAISMAQAAGPAGNQVDLELVLAVDISGSMDYDEQRVQRDGYVQAFRDPQVINAITDGLIGRIAVTYIEWSDAEIQFQVTPWTLIDGKDSAYAFAAALAKAPLHRARSTSISGALLYSQSLFDKAAFSPVKKTIDVSGDGANNNGPPVTQARDSVVKRGITINGLPILVHNGGAGGFGQQQDIANLDEYYRDCVIGGSDSFMFSIDKLEEFPVAIRRKLIQEIASLPPPLHPIFERAAATTDCLIGEKLRRGGRGFGGFDFSPGP